jgi:UDP-glucose 4-epimerase
MRILVLGGNGFIGSHLVDELLEAGHAVNIFDRYPDAWQRADARVKYFIGDFSDSILLSEAMQGVDMVAHLISTTVPGTSNLDPIADIQDNLVRTVRMLQLMETIGIKRILYLSSGGTVYGIPQFTPIPEDHPLNPICSYGVVKVAVENYLRMYANLHHIEPVIIRPSNPYGPRQRFQKGQGAVATFMNRIMTGERIAIWGDGNIKRDYIYIQDLTRLCRMAIEQPHTGTFNAGSGVSMTLNNLLRSIEQQLGSKAEVEYQTVRKFDVPEIALDIKRAEKVYGWAPEINIEEGLARYHDWLAKAGSNALPI